MTENPPTFKVSLQVNTSLHVNYVLITNQIEPVSIIDERIPFK